MQISINLAINSTNLSTSTHNNTQSTTAANTPSTATSTAASSLGIIKDAPLVHSQQEMNRLHNGIRPFGVEFISANSHMMKDFFTDKLGFNLVSYNGPENHTVGDHDAGDTTARTYAVKDGSVTFLLTEALMDRRSVDPNYRYDSGSTGAIADDPTDRLAFQNSHKAAARRVLKAVPVDKNFQELIVKTAENFNATHVKQLDIDTLIHEGPGYKYAIIPTAGGVQNLFFQSNKNLSSDLPGLAELRDGFFNVSEQEIEQAHSTTSEQIEATEAFIDHIVTNGPEQTMKLITEERANLFGHQVSQVFEPKDVRTEHTALYSQVSHTGDAGTRTHQNEYTPVNEPVSMREKLERSGGNPVYLGQIEAHVDAAGVEVQHIALNYPDVVEKVSDMRSHGFQFLKNAGGKEYYEAKDEHGWSLRDYMVREGGFEPVRFDQAKDLDIMFSVENKEGIRNGEKPRALVQIFSRHVFGEMSLFFEFITRHNDAQGFGKENFNGLYRSLEELQKDLGLFVKSDGTGVALQHHAGHTTGSYT